MMYVISAALLLLCHIMASSALCPAVKPTKLDCSYVKVGIFCGEGTDLKCAEGEECCKGICGGRYCSKTNISPPKHGSCPKVDLSIQCVKQGEVTCKNNRDCPRTQKCCETICGGRGCVSTKPIVPVSDECPAVIQNIDCALALVMNQCLGEQEGSCAQDEICCVGVCGGSYCKKRDLSIANARIAAADSSVDASILPVPIIGLCPKVNPLILCFKQGPVLCKSDLNCLKNQRCCATQCGGRACLTVKPSVCAYVDPQIVCIQAEPRECESNSQCGYGNTCCPTICGGTKCSGGGSSLPLSAA